MSYRAFRDNRVPEMADEIVYRIRGVSREFVAYPHELCQDCSTPVITLRDKVSGKALRVWHDETCPSNAPEEARLHPKVLNHQK